MLHWLSRPWQRPTASSGGQLDASEFAVHPPHLRFLTDVSPGRWVEESFPFAFASVCALVPGGYEGYVRVLHPAWDASGRMVPWSAVAAWSGRVYHPQMSFEGICSPVPGHGADPSPWEHDPNHGILDEEVVAELLPLLARFTGTPEQCYFGVWEGYGQYSGGTTMLTSDGSGRPLSPPPDIRRAQRIRGCDRNYLLYTGFYTNFRSQPPSIWWPADRTWFVATDIDLDSTYVGGSQQCINALLRHPVLEAVPAEYRASVAMTADTINLGDPI